MFKRIIERIVTREIDKRFYVDPPAPPVGYNSLDKIRGAMFHWLPVPFSGSQVWCKVRTLNRTQMDASGAFGILNLKDNKAPTKDDLIELRNSQEALIKATMLSPTFSEIEVMIFGEDGIMNDKKAQLAEIEKTAKESKELNSEERAKIDEEIYRLRMFTGFVLPEDTFGFLTSWALGVDVSDMKKITREQLYHASILAKNGNNSPSDNLSGVFSDRDKAELDSAAWTIYQEHQELNKIGKGRQMRWIGGPK